MRRLVTSFVFASMCVLSTGSGFAPDLRTAQQLPLPYQGPAGQVITVVGASSGTTTAQLTAWTRTGNGWTRSIGPLTANVGRAGIGKAAEGVARTPAGVFGLTEAFGILPNNGTRLPYRRVDTSDWWVSDVNSPAYNTHYRCAPGTCPFNESAGENLGRAGAVYNHAVVIDYNRNPVTPGAGSAFFLHISNGQPTAGCVSVPAASLDAIMRWLDPAQHPVINIGVRARA
jgi:L,D-peptidoglycan transpeptidase YkuD (ErfK/YbiS/YcfS/YnhG family)